MIDKKNLDVTLNRYLSFFERRLEDGILANIPVAPKSRFADQPESAGETRIRECLLLEDLEGYMRGQEQNDAREWLCDSIPALYPTAPFGESIWSGLLGAEILFAGNNIHTWSYSPKPLISSIDSFFFPNLSPDNFWFQKMLEVTDYFTQQLKPNYDVMHFIFMDCLNLLVELRGPMNAYTDVYDFPRFTRKFMDWSVRENIRLFDAQNTYTKDFVKCAYDGHPVLKYAHCNVPSLSIDAYGLCGKEIYENFGLEQHIKIVEHFGGGRLHIHGNGRHLCRLVSKNERLTVCSMGDDVGYVKAHTIVDRLNDEMYPVPIVVAIPKELFVVRLNERSLPSGVAYTVTGAESVIEANEIMQKVFDYYPRRKL